MSQPKAGQKYSLVDYINWNEEERWEILDGIAVMRSSFESTSGNFRRALSPDSQLSIVMPL